MERTLFGLMFFVLNSGIYSQECPLRSVPGRPGMYQQLIHGSYIERMCAPGTNFDQSQCLCSMHADSQSGFTGQNVPHGRGDSFLKPRSRKVPDIFSPSSKTSTSSLDRHTDMIFSLFGANGKNKQPSSSSFNSAIHKEPTQTNHKGQTSATPKPPQTEFQKPKKNKMSTSSTSNKNKPAAPAGNNNKEINQINNMMQMELLRMMLGRGRSREPETQNEPVSLFRNTPARSNMAALLMAINAGMVAGDGRPAALPTPQRPRKSKSGTDQLPQSGISNMASLLAMMQGEGSNRRSSIGTPSMMSLLQQMSGSGTGNSSPPARQPANPMSDLFGLGMGMGGMGGLGGMGGMGGLGGLGGMGGMGGMGLMGGLGAMNEPGEGPDRTMAERMGMGDTGDQMGSAINMQLMRRMGMGNPGTSGSMGGMGGLGGMAGMGLF